MNNVVETKENVRIGVQPPTLQNNNNNNKQKEKKTQKCYSKQWRHPLKY